MEVEVLDLLPVLQEDYWQKYRLLAYFVVVGYLPLPKH
jgi:hypothetical protein